MLQSFSSINTSINMATDIIAKHTKSRLHLAINESHWTREEGDINPSIRGVHIIYRLGRKPKMYPVKRRAASLEVTRYPLQTGESFCLWEIFICQHLLNSPLPFPPACLAHAMKRSVQIFTKLKKIVSQSAHLLTCI